MPLKYTMFLRTFLAGFGLVGLPMVSQIAVATVYNFPTADGETLAVAPQALSNGDSLNINSGTFQTSSSSSVAYTVASDTATTTGTAITIASDATISYSGTNTAGAAIRSIRTDTGTTTDTITINGTATNGTGLYSIYLSNTNASPNDIYNISNTGTIIGSILSSGVRTVTLDVSGATASIDGTISLAVNTAGTSTLNVLSSANFIPAGFISNISAVNVSGNSLLTLNNVSTNIKELTMEAGSTTTINAQISGVIGGDGAIINDGTLNIAANIAKTGTFTGTGTNVVSQAITVSTSNYAITNHTAVLTDSSNYGNMTLTTGNLNSITNFAVTYNGGYFSGGTFTLASGQTSITTPPTFAAPPSPTLFLTFATPMVSDKNIQITTTRVGFQNFASNTMTQAIGVNIEAIGLSNPNSEMISLLNAIEASTTANQVEYSLQQLAPLTTAPIFGLEVQNNSMRQVQLRLAELRDRDSYFAGDIAKDNYIWIRPFGGYANQQAKDDSLGYYGSGGGVAAGFDRNLDVNYNVGAAGVYVLSHVKDKVNITSNTEIKSYVGMVYGTYNYPDTHYFDWIVAVVANNFNASRVVNINGYYQTALSSYGSQQFSVKGLWGREYAAFGFMQLTPMATAQYTFAKQYEYTESDGAATNLTISRTNSNLVQLGLGAKAAIPLWVNPSIIIPEIHALAFYNPVIGQQNSVFSFVDGGGQITSIFDLSRTGLFYGAALTIAVVDKLEIKTNIDFNIQDRFNAYVVYLNLRYMI